MHGIGGLSARRNTGFRRGAFHSYAYAADDSLTKSWRADGSAASYFEYDKTGSCVKIHSGDGTTYFEYQERPGSTGTGANMVSKLAKLGGSAWEFAHDGNLRRYAIVEDGTPTYYLWDGLRLLETYSPAGTLKARFTYGEVGGGRYLSSSAKSSTALQPEASASEPPVSSCLRLHSMQVVA